MVGVTEMSKLTLRAGYAVTCSPMVLSWQDVGCPKPREADVIPVIVMGAHMASTAA